MLPFMPSSSPAWAARAVSGLTPMARITIPASSGSLSFRRTRSLSPLSSKPSTAAPRWSLMPFCRNFPWTKEAISGSRGFRSCMGRWTMETSMPSSRRFSASSRLIKPPPARTTEPGFSRRTNSRIFRLSSTVRRVNTRASSTPAAPAWPAAHQGRGAACRSSPQTPRRFPDSER